MKDVSIPADHRRLLVPPRHRPTSKMRFVDRHIRNTREWWEYLQRRERLDLVTRATRAEAELKRARDDIATLTKRNARLRRDLKEMSKARKEPRISLGGAIPAPLAWIRGPVAELTEWRPIGPCVYFLIRDARVVYVGQAVNLQSRLISHLEDKAFDRVFFLFIKSKREVDAVEGAFIRHFSPSYNRSTGPRIKSVEAVLSRYGLRSAVSGTDELAIAPGGV